MELCKVCKTNRAIYGYKLVQTKGNIITYWCKECLRKYTNKYTVAMSSVYTPKNLRIMKDKTHSNTITGLQKTIKSIEYSKNIH